MREVRQNKGSILKASVDYIRKLKVDQARNKFLEEKCRIQEYQTRKLIGKLQVCCVAVWSIDYLYSLRKPVLYN